MKVYVVIDRYACNIVDSAIEQVHGIFSTRALAEAAAAKIDARFFAGYAAIHEMTVDGHVHEFPPGGVCACGVKSSTVYGWDH